MIKLSQLIKYLFLFIFIVIFYFPIGYIIQTTISKYNIINEISSRPRLIDAITVSFITSIITTLFSIVVATLAALGINSFSRKTQTTISQVSKLPLMYPDIILAIGLLAIFIYIFGKGNFGWITLIGAHISFGIIYSFIVVYPKAKKISIIYYEASEDLGATPFQTLIWVILPNLKEVIIGGMAITFAMSFDDYIISKINMGLLENISSYLMSSKKIIFRLPGIYALITLMIISLVLIFGVYKIIYFQKRFKK